MAGDIDLIWELRKSGIFLQTGLDRGECNEVICLSGDRPCSAPLAEASADMDAGAAMTPASGSPAKPSVVAGYSCEFKLSLVRKRSSRSAEYTRPLGAVIDTANPSAASLRASVTAISALERKSVVRRLSFTDSMMNVIWPAFPFKLSRLSQAVQQDEQDLDRFEIFAACADGTCGNSTIYRRKSHCQQAAIDRMEPSPYPYWVAFDVPSHPDTQIISTSTKACFESANQFGRSAPARTRER